VKKIQKFLTSIYYQTDITRYFKKDNRIPLSFISEKFENKISLEPKRSRLKVVD